ncbi:hypothetical protein ACLKA7_002947 [Drosophila subpalustris]
MAKKQIESELETETELELGSETCHKEALNAKTLANNCILMVSNIIRTGPYPWPKSEAVLTLPPKLVTVRFIRFIPFRFDECHRHRHR